MTKSEIKQSEYFPTALDEAVTKKFGVRCESGYNFLTLSYVTVFGDSVWDADKHTWVDDPAITPELKERISLFIEGWTAGNTELRERLADKSKWIQ